MHISEGVLPSWMLITGWGLSLAGISIGLRKLDDKKLPLAALLSATFFVASLIHVPVGITSVHLLLNGLVGVLLGWAVFPVLFVALFFQAILFQFGGLTVLGVNTFNMAFSGLVAYYVTRPILNSKFPPRWKFLIAGTLTAAAGVFTAALFLSLELLATGTSFKSTAILAFLAHIPVAAVEAIFNTFALSFIEKTLPELLEER